MTGTVAQQDPDLGVMPDGFGDLVSGRGDCAPREPPPLELECIGIRLELEDSGDALGEPGPNAHRSHGSRLGAGFSRASAIPCSLASRV